MKIYLACMKPNIFCLGSHSGAKDVSFRLAGVLGDDVYTGQWY
jgi:hypothetical protein